MNKMSSFTLIELLIVIIILGILAAIALPRLTGTVEYARASEAMNFMSHIREGLIAWASTHNGTYTADFGDLGFQSGGGVTLNAGETTAALKYWTVSIVAGSGLVQADRDMTDPPTDSAGSDWVTLSIDGTWAGDYWGTAGHPALPPA